jgi:gliding motility-associated-like protein
MKQILHILILSIFIVSCTSDRLSNESDDNEKLDPSLSAVVVPLQIFETGYTIESCFYKNNFLRMIATHPQATNYAWYKCADNSLSNTDIFLSDSSHYQTSLEGLYRLDILKKFPQLGEIDTTIFIELEYCETWIETPTSFTPDNQQQFNTWQPILEGVNQFYYRITDEDDLILFESTSLQNSFDGNYGGAPLPSGTYYFYISGTYKSRVLFEKKGNFELVR